MSYYFIAQIRINDQKEYQKYLDKSAGIFKKFNGEYIAVDSCPQLLEGSWNYSRTVLIRFEEKSDFEAWYYSEDYQQILKYRLAAAECDTLLVTGLTK
jgi:uncharacterized protein (DUF1330 family)